MNALSGLLRLDQRTVSPEEMSPALFRSPYWTPDHEAVYAQGSLGFSCTQRFITPQCPRGTMPFEDPVSGCIVVGDFFLTDRDRLIPELGCLPGAPDVELILKAYLKWGTQCPIYLCGAFMFAIWDPRCRQLFITVDHTGDRPCLYTYTPGQHFIFGNTMLPFRTLCPTLTIDPELFMRFSLDSVAAEATCYQEVKRLRPGHYLVISESGDLTITQYWDLKREKKSLGLKSREDYYAAFRALFNQVVRDMRRSPYPISAQISGGLDSSSVASVAANQMLATNETLHGYTSIPNGLDGPSYRKNWEYHEMPRVQKILDHYPNIDHVVHKADLTVDYFDLVREIYPLIDQPLRNISNMLWIFDGLKIANALNSRILLTGSRGNGSISWTGTSLRSKLSRFYHGLKSWFLPNRLFKGYYNHHHTDFIKSPEAQAILRRRGIILDPQHWMLCGIHSAPRMSSIRPVYLWHGVEHLDPTNDTRMIRFCYNVPSWVYQKGPEILDQRLLIREGLVGILPDEIRFNPFRGEQGADWFEHYNRHVEKWLAYVTQFIQDHPDHFLFKFYDPEKMVTLFKPRIERPNAEDTLHICCNLFRFMSAIQFSDYLMMP